jgi:hypothetical protein
MLATPGLRDIAPLPDFDRVLEFTQDSGIITVSNPVTPVTTIVIKYVSPLQSYFFLEEILIVVSADISIATWSLIIDGVPIYPWISQIPHGTFTTFRGVGVAPLLTIEGGRTISLQITNQPKLAPDQTAIGRISGRVLRPAAMPDTRSRIRPDLFR